MFTRTRSSRVNDIFTLAGAQAAANSAWVEINRPLTALALGAPMSKMTYGPILPDGRSRSDLSVDLREGQLACPTPAGHVLQLPVVHLPIGSDIKSVTCVSEDVPDWLLLNFTFGTMNLVNPQGSSGGVNLTGFDQRAPHADKVTPWILSKTKVDVAVTAQLLCCAYRYHYALMIDTDRAGRGVEAIFRGFSINMFQEEQVCAIQTRIEPTDRNVGSAELISHFRQTISSDQLLGEVYRTPIAHKIHRAAATIRELRHVVHALGEVRRSVTDVLRVDQPRS